MPQERRLSSRVTLQADPILDADDRSAVLIIDRQRDSNYFDLGVSISLTASG